MTSNKLLILILLTSFISFTCNETSEDTSNISGSIDYVGDASVTVFPPPLHYKYSPKKEYAIEPLADGSFDITINESEADLLNLQIDDETFTLINDPEDNLTLNIARADFPLGIEIKSLHQDDYKAYLKYLNDIEGLDKQIELEMNKYKDGEPNQAITLSNKKIEIAERNLKNTKYDFLIDKAEGELLVNQIKSVEYRFDQPDFDANSERKRILNEAKENGFFSLESLEAQRAGIRDVTHYYARTFGIYDSVNQANGKELAEYDIKRLAYGELNEKRLQVIDYIDERKAEAYARMFLVAERIGELELSVAEESYRSYLKGFSEFTEYTDFLTYFYNEIKSVSPGEPAIPFTLPNQSGEMVSMSDFEGKYVLLDFWAGWCQPCLDEFPVMREIYNDFSREDFEIIGISTEIDKEVWEYDIERFKNPWVQLYGGNGFDQKTFKAYKGGGIPFYILIDPDGNIIRYNDIRATFNLREVLNELINEN